MFGRDPDGGPPPGDGRGRGRRRRPLPRRGHGVRAWPLLLALLDRRE
jgi:hypothetical protein